MKVVIVFRRQILKKYKTLLPTLEIERKIITNLTEVKKKTLKNGMTINSTPQIK